MKKATAAIISFVLIFSSFFVMLDMTGNAEGEDIAPAPFAGGTFGGGNGTVWAPYIIEDVDDLQNMSANLSAHYVLNNTIDADSTATWNGYAGFIPVGNASAQFNGSLDGAGYTIFNLTIDRPSEDYVGLFGWCGASSVIQNVILNDLLIFGRDDVGGLVGTNDGMVTSCSITGSINGNDATGGLVGKNRGNIADSTAALTSSRTIPLNVSDLIAHWKMDETSWDGTPGEVVDSTGMEHNGNISGNPNTTPGNYGNAGSFDGDDHVNVSYSSETNANIFTVSLWARVDGGAGTFRSPITSRDNIPERGYMMYAADTDQWVFNIGTGSTWYGITGSAVVIGEWAHLVGRYNGSVLSFYVNGVKVGEGATAFSPNTVRDMRIGAGATEGPPNLYFNGSIDDVRIYSRSISDTEVDKLYSMGSTTTGVIGNSFVGGISGYNNGTILNSYSTGRKEGSSNYVGGITGYNTGTINNTINYGDATGMNDYVGGIAGYSSGDIMDSFSTGQIEGYDYLGGLAGTNDGSILDSYSTGQIRGELYLGGFVGQNNAIISDSWSDGFVNGVSSLGGFVGLNQGTISVCNGAGDVIGDSSLGGFVGLNFGDTYECRSTGDVFVTNDWGGFAGGFAGSNSNTGNIVDCHSIGSATSPYPNSLLIGGFIGKNDGYIVNSSSEGNTIGKADIGGFVGLNLKIIERCTSSGYVLGTGTNAGGFVARNAGSGAITDCYSIGMVNGEDTVGGFAGINYDYITNCYSTGYVTGTTTVGGFIGTSLNEINCFWDIDTSGWTTSSGSSTGKTTTEMKKQAIFTNWNFTSIWGIYEDYTYPFLEVLGTSIEADLELVISDIAPNPCNTGDAVQYLVDVTNHGPDPAFDTVINITLPAEVTWNSDNKSAGPPAGQYLEWSAGTMYAGESTAWLINVTVDVSGDITAFASTTTKTPDPGLYPNTDSTSTAVNTPPIAGNDTATFAEDSGTNIINVLANDMDADGDNLIISVVTQGVRGTVGIINVGKTVTYTPDADFNGEDFFNYTIDDGNGGTDNATVNVTVMPMNDAPIASDDFNTINEDTILNVAAPGVLANDTDPDASDTLSVVADTYLTINGAVVTINADGSYTYDPIGSATLQALAVGEYLIDSFTYTVTDGNGGMDTATVYVNVTGMNDTPAIITDDITEIIAGQAYSVDYDATDIDASDTMTWGLNSDADWLSMDTATGVISGTPTNDDAGNYWVNVSVDDGNGGTDFTNFTLEVVPDTDLDGVPDDTDTDDDGDGWNDTVEELAGTYPLDNTSMPSDADSDGIADFMDPDFLTVTEYNNQTINQTVYSNSTVWNNATADLGMDSDSDGWSDVVEILAGTDPEDAADEPADDDDDGIADFMDSDFLTTEVPVYNNNTIWNNGTADPQTETITETPSWAWGALIAAIVLGMLAAMGFMGKGGKPDGAEEELAETSEEVPEEPASDISNPEIQDKS